MTSEPVVGVEIRIDDAVCIGVGVCVETEPEAVLLGDDGVSRPVPGYRLPRERAVVLCQNCPSGAIAIATGDRPDPSLADIHR